MSTWNDPTPGIFTRMRRCGCATEAGWEGQPVEQIGRRMARAHNFDARARYYRPPCAVSTFFERAERSFASQGVNASSPSAEKTALSSCGPVRKFFLNFYRGGEHLGIFTCEFRGLRVRSQLEVAHLNRGADRPGKQTRPSLGSTGRLQPSLGAESAPTSWTLGTQVGNLVSQTAFRHGPSVPRSPREKRSSRSKTEPPRARRHAR